MMSLEANLFDLYTGERLPAPEELATPYVLRAVSLMLALFVSILL
jgi:hypothetical protein